MRNASGGTGGREASVVELADITGIVPTAGVEYTVLPNTCIACPRNTYQPLKAQAATGSLGLGAFSACRWGARVCRRVGESDGHRCRPSRKAGMAPKRFGALLVACAAAFASETDGLLLGNPAWGACTYGTENATDEWFAGRPLTLCRPPPPPTHLLPQRRCEDGWWSPPGSAYCQPCPAGSYRNSYFDGTVQLSNAAQSLTYNLANETAPNTLASCFLCPKGTFAPDPGASVCQPCPAGTHAAATGSTGCNRCGAGTNSLYGLRGQQLSWQSNIATGPTAAYYTYTISGFDKALYVGGGAAPGNRSAWRLLRNATTEDRNFWLAGKGEPCAYNLPGYYTDVEGLPVQLPCKPGYFSPEPYTDKTKCFTCTFGTFNEEFAQRECWRQRWRC